MEWLSRVPTNKAAAPGCSLVLFKPFSSLGAFWICGPADPQILSQEDIIIIIIILGKGVMLLHPFPNCREDPALLAVMPVFFIMVVGRALCLQHCPLAWHLHLPNTEQNCALLVHPCFLKGS